MVIIKNSIKLLLVFSFVASFVSSPLSAVHHKKKYKRQNHKKYLNTVAKPPRTFAKSRAKQRARAEVVAQNRQYSLLAQKELRDDNIELKDTMKAILADNIELKADNIKLEDKINAIQKMLVHCQNLSTKKFHKIIFVSGFVGGVVVGIFAVGSCIFWKVLNGHADQLLGHGVRFDELGEAIAWKILNFLGQGHKVERVSDSIAIGAQATNETLKEIPNVVTEQTIQTIAESGILHKIGRASRWFDHIVMPTNWFPTNWFRFR